MPFSQIPIDTKEIEQGKLNIDDKQRSNLFAWNGQFSPQFIEILLSNYAEPEFVILDPFVGSGTTLCECSRKQLASYGVELNISAYYMAKIYELSSLSKNQRVQIINGIECLIKSVIDESKIMEILLKAPEEIKNQVFLLIILMDIYNKAITFDLLNMKWNKLKTIIIDLPHNTKVTKALRGDSRVMNLRDGLADLLITSPPYINVFNYHQKYRRSVEALGYDVLSTAKTEIGSNRKNRGNRFLTIIQYCIDMGLAIKDACRVCKPDSRMIYIVGRESSVLGYSFCNSELIYEIGTHIFNLTLMLRQERFFKNRYGQFIYEDILHFRNTCYNSPSDDIVIHQARDIAVKMLHSKLSLDNDNKNRSLLIQAISNNHQVNKSEVLK
mgnify:CR=1 FL=1